MQACAIEPEVRYFRTSKSGLSRVFRSRPLVKGNEDAGYEGGLISETKPVTPYFYFISETSKSLSLRSRSLKKIYRVENFRANVLKQFPRSFERLRKKIKRIAKSTTRYIFVYVHCYICNSVDFERSNACINTTITW